MDTRFWGPSGWKLIHLVAAEPMKTERHRKAVAAWFSLLPYILPCRYCRASLTDYYVAQPLTETILRDPSRFSRWAYDIHNRVNEKLREQGLLTSPNPIWEEVREHYSTEHSSLCKGTPLLGWDFMTSIAFNTPERDYIPVPMSDTPEDRSKEMDARTRNRYNLLTRAERLRWLHSWWTLTPAILPCSAWRSAWALAMNKVGEPPIERGRDAMVRWMWKIEAHVCADLKCPTPHASLADLTVTVGSFESGCGVSKKGKTCRTLKKSRRDRVRTQRHHRGQDVL